MTVFCTIVGAVLSTPKRVRFAAAVVLLATKGTPLTNDVSALPSASVVIMRITLVVAVLDSASAPADVMLVNVPVAVVALWNTTVTLSTPGIPPRASRLFNCAASTAQTAAAVPVFAGVKPVEFGPQYPAATVFAKANVPLTYAPFALPGPTIAPVACAT